MATGRCEIRITRRYDAPPAEVWSALHDLHTWLRPPQGVTIAHADEERRLELDWRPVGEPPSSVVLELHADGDQTVVVLEHTQIEATRGMRYLAVWPRRLDGVSFAA
jgi:uncharacterized protein YndB with AHSA1/START domain